MLTSLLRREVRRAAAGRAAVYGLARRMGRLVRSRATRLDWSPATAATGSARASSSHAIEVFRDAGARRGLCRQQATARLGPVRITDRDHRGASAESTAATTQ